MEKEKILSLLNRQLKDIQAQAERILRGDSTPEAIEGFSKYSQELKDFILKKIEDPEIITIAKELPAINYKRNKIQFWQYLIFPTWWIYLYKDYHVRQKSLEEINTSKGKLASLQLLTNSDY